MTSTRVSRWRVAAAAAVVAIGLTGAVAYAEPDSAPAGAVPAQPQLVCVVTPLALAGGAGVALPAPGAATSGAAPGGLAPVGITRGITTVAPIQSTVGSGAPSTSLPSVVLLTPEPGNGAYVVSTATTQPSLPGVTLVAPQVLIPPNAAPGQVPSLVAAGLLQSVPRPAAGVPPVICFNVR